MLLSVRHLARRRVVLLHARDYQVPHLPGESGQMVAQMREIAAEEGKLDRLEQRLHLVVWRLPLQVDKLLHERHLLLVIAASQRGNTGLDKYRQCLHLFRHIVFIFIVWFRPAIGDPVLNGSDGRSIGMIGGQRRRLPVQNSKNSREKLHVDLPVGSTLLCILHGLRDVLAPRSTALRHGCHDGDGITDDGLDLLRRHG